jgi:hypothetical protein
MRVPVTMIWRELGAPFAVRWCPPGMVRRPFLPVSRGSV